MVENNNIITWNCRGAAGKDFYRYVKQYIVVYKPNILVIMETRCEPNRVAKVLKKLGFDDIVSNSNDGYAGGIIVAWKSYRVQIELVLHSDQFLHMRVIQANGNDWYFTVVCESQ